jgi:CobQ-like glutamine amidotransferase family enzyme
MSDKAITILHLYPKEMNIYGDWGNVLTIKRRLEWHGYTPKLLEHHPGKPFPKNVDIIIGGGGQDSGQAVVQNDLLAIGETLHILADAGTPMLVICGLYQLFGRFFKTAEGKTIEGIGIFKAETHGGPKRLIGNTVVDSMQFGELIGYENHSGLTLLDNDQPALGRIIKGKGNNGEDTTEGAVYKNVYGSYLHGSLLPKNPALADELIRVAITKRYGAFNPHDIDDTFATYAREFARRRPR